MNRPRWWRAGFRLGVAMAVIVLAPACGWAAEEQAGPTSTVPEWRSWIVSPRSQVDSLEIAATAGGPPLQLDLDGDGAAEPVALARTLESQAPLTLLARTLDRTVDGRRYHEVYLPIRPNQSVGWVADDDVVVQHTDFRIAIDLSTRRLEVADGSRVVGTYDIAIGSAEHPTPLGTFFIKEVLKPSDPAGVYGPLAIGLSGHSDTILDSQEFADGVIGIHGTNQPELIGQGVSHGCIRLRNDDITAIGAMGLPLGTPVTITE